MNTENIENDRSDKVTVVIHKTFQSIKTLGLLAVTVVLGSDSDLRDWNTCSSSQKMYILNCGHIYFLPSVPEFCLIWAPVIAKDLYWKYDLISSQTTHLNL